MADHSDDQATNEREDKSSASRDAHDITTLSDLPGKKMKTKLWPMSPIESLSEEEVLAIASRDQTPVLIAVMEGDGSGEKYLCTNKRGVTLPPEVAAEGSWAQKYYQQVAVLNDSLKEMKESFQPVWELAKSQQALLVSVEVFDGLLAVANQGLQQMFKSWTHAELKSILTRQCDIRVRKQVHYYSILKNYTTGKFESLDLSRLQRVEDLLLAGETYLMHHACTNGFHCPSDIRTLFQEFLPLKRDRNEYSHPLTLARKPLASVVLQKLRASVLNDEFDFMKGTKNLILLGADYAESVLQSYGKVRQKLFLDPKRSNRKQHQSFTSDADDDEDDSSPDTRSPQLLSPRSPSPSYTQSPHSQRASSPEESFQVGQSSQGDQNLSPSKTRPSSPRHVQSSPSESRLLGSPLVLTFPHGSETLRGSHIKPAANTLNAEFHDHQNSPSPRNSSGPESPSHSRNKSSAQRFKKPRQK